MSSDVRIFHEATIRRLKGEIQDLKKKNKELKNSFTIASNRMKKIQPMVTQFTGWANFENYVLNYMHDDILKLAKLEMEKDYITR